MDYAHSPFKPPATQNLIIIDFSRMQSMHGQRTYYFALIVHCLPESSTRLPPNGSCSIVFGREGIMQEMK